MLESILAKQNSRGVRNNNAVMFDNKFYEIDFSDNVRTHTLRYKIDDNPVSRIWLGRVRLSLASPDCHIGSNQFVTTVATDEKIEATWAVIKRLVDEVNSGQFIKAPFIDMPMKYGWNNDNINILNFLHLQFHKFQEETTDLNVGYNPLHQLNVEIHALESLIECQLDANKPAWLSCVFHLVSDVPIIEVPIDDQDLYKYWNYDEAFGDLVLGYHTVGKNIHQCWLSNDINLVKTGMVRAQRTISNEVCLLFNPSEPPGQRASYITLVQNWVRDNDLNQYIDMTQLCNNIVGAPYLGSLVENYTREDINSILEQCKVSNVRLIEHARPRRRAGRDLLEIFMVNTHLNNIQGPLPSALTRTFVI